MKSAKKIAASLLGIMCTAGLAAGISGCKGCKKGDPVAVPENITTVRYALPNDGSTPAAHTGLENIGYMATVLDNQPSYHAFANNSTKAMGYEQVTKTWKDYKNKSLSGYESGVMVCTDLSYSAFVKSGIQTCFVNDQAYVRTSGKPGKDTTPSTADWSNSVPEQYDKNTYLTKYGEFSTELSVYVLNEDTVESCDPVTVNDDGTYTQKFYLNDSAACYYQHKMKTNGNLKGYPTFNRIEISFTFDSGWQVLSSYCEEKTDIAPKALGGMSMSSNSKTETTFSYGAEEFDAVNYGYFESYFKDYVGTDIKPVDPDGNKTPELLDVLGGGFGQVMNGGQRFALDLTLGGTEYNGVVYADLGDMSDVLNSLNAAVALEKAGSGKQDFFLEFKNGAVNAFYSDTFAVTANLDAVKTVAGQFSDWIKRFDNPDKTPDEGSSGGGSSLDLGELLAALKFEYGDDWVKISLKTDNLLGTGIGADVQINFDRTVDEDGNSYSFKSASIDSITYNSDSISLSAAIIPDGTEAISRDLSSAAANLADYISGVYNMLNSNTLKVGLNFDGDKQGVIHELAGVKLDAEAYVELGRETATRADIKAEYAGMNLKLAAYYDVNIYGGNYGKVYLNLTELNGVSLDAKVYSNINDTVTAVKQLLAAVNASGAAPAALTEVQSEEAVNKLAAIVNGVLNLDFGKVLGDLYASNSEIRVSADVDEIIGALGVDVKGIKFGTAALKLNLNDNEKTSLNLSLAALGLNASVEGADDTLTKPDEDLYLDATVLVGLVTKAAEAAKDIISAQDIIFDIDATVTADNVPLAVKGSGEAVWKNGKTRVALDVTLSVADGTASAKKDSVALKLVYDETVEGETDPFVKFAVNNLAMEIRRGDINELKNTINKIKESVDLLINGQKTGNAQPVQAVAAYSGTAAYAEGGEGSAVDIEKILTNSGVQKILNAVLGFAGNLNVTLGNAGVNDQSVNALIIKHATAGELMLATDGNLWLDLDSDVAEVYAAVKAGGGAKIAEVTKALAQCKTYTTAEAEEAFVKVVYNYMFAVVEDLSIENVLGSKTYTVKATLDGGRSGVEALSGISASANLYYTQGLDGTAVTKNKLAEIDLELDINGTFVKVNARYSSRNIYISLDKIGTTVYNDVKFTASADDIYGAAEQLVKLITDENIINTLGSILHPAQQQTAVHAAADGETKSALTDVISKIFTLDFAKAFKWQKVDGVNTATIELDYILDTLGVNAPKLGTVKVGFNPETHRIDANLAIGANPAWASLSAEAASRRVYADNWQAGYIDIGFMKTLVSDLANTLTDNETGAVHRLYTFSGNAKIDVNVNVVGLNINKSIELDITTLTLGIDEDGEFYFTLLAHLKESYVNLLLSKIYLCHDWNIAVTYSNGRITMGREVGTNSAKFKVMTLDYMLDNIFAKHEGNTDSPLRWMLGMSDDIWNIIAGAVNVNSGLTKPQTYSLYGDLAQARKDDSNFYLSSILNGLAVNINKDNVSDYGTKTAAAEALELTENYYAFDINASKLTNKLLKSLYLGLYRSDAQGIYGLCAKAAMSPASGINLDININLDKYLEGVTETEGEFGKVAAPNFYKTVNASVEGGIAFNRKFESTDPNTTPKFGCYNSEDGSYEASYVLVRRNLTVKDESGSVLYEIDLAHGSTVNLTNSFSPNWTDDTHTSEIYYTDEAGNDLGAQYTPLNADTVIIAKSRPATEVIFDIGIDGLVINGVATDKLDKYPLDGYTFLGWYNDPEFETGEVTDVSGITNYENGIRKVYGFFVRSEVTVNGVKYTLSSETREYAVSGYDTEGIKPYTQSGATLVLENRIDGYKVTSINASAFNGMGKTVENGGIGAGLKNVVVPENITVVGAQAFRDNYGLESVTFLADSVRFGGTTGTGDDSRYVFYGCSVSESDDKRTNLILHYNNYTCDDSNHWNCFKFESGVFSSTYYHIDSYGGKQYGAGTWSKVEYTQEGADLTQGLKCLTSGIKYDSMTADDIKSAVIAELNGRTEKSGYINAYDVTVSGGYTADGKIHSITVNVTEKAASAYWYPLTVESTVADCTASYTVAEESRFTLNGVVYVAAGTSMSLTAAADEQNVYAFGGWTGAEVEDEKSMNTTFEMPAAATAIKANWTANYAENTYVYSEVAFNYNGRDYGTGTVRLENATVDKALADPVADGYSFLGWASDNGGLEFTGNTVADKTAQATYCAIWAVNRDGVKFPVNTSGTLPTVDVTGDGEFYNWYAKDDTDFTGNTIGAISTDNTVLRARLQYSLTVNFNAKNTKVYQTSNTDLTFVKDGSQSTVSANSEAEIFDIGNSKTDKTMIYTVLEGNALNLAVNSGATNKLILSVSNQFELVYRARKWEKGWGWNETGDRTFNDNAEHTVTVNGTKLDNGTGNIYNGSAVSGNISVDIIL